MTRRRCRPPDVNCALDHLAGSDGPDPLSGSPAFAVRDAAASPDFASAYGRTAHCYVIAKTNGWFSDTANEIAEVTRLAQREVELGKDDAIALAASGCALAYVVRDLEVGAGLIDRALVLNSNLAEAWFYGGWVKNWLGEPEAAIERSHVSCA